MCDLQDKFRGGIAHFPEVVAVSQRLVSTAKIMGIPIVVTEQCVATAAEAAARCTPPCSCTQHQDTGHCTALYPCGFGCAWHS